MRKVTKWKYFKHITWPNFCWKYLGVGLYDNCKSYWHLNIMKREQYWLEASQNGCPKKYCRYCGKGKKL